MKAGWACFAAGAGGRMGERVNRESERTGGVRIRVHRAGLGLRCALWACVAFSVVATLAPAAHAQWMGKQTGCYAESIQANPNRPTVANPADITQYGVLELEYGWDRTSLGAGARLSDGEGLLKFGLLCDVELRWTMTSVLVENRQAGGQTGTGDNWFGPQIRIYKQTAHVPTLAFSYAVKAPTASTEKGFGTGRVDHAFEFLASKDIHGVHFDFNTTYFLVGRQFASGFDSRGQMNLSFSRPIHGKLGFTGEFYGDTELNAQNPAFASSLWALTYNFLPRLVVDGGIDVGLTHGAPQKRFFAGVTYSITNLYKDLKKKSGPET